MEPDVIGNRVKEMMKKQEITIEKLAERMEIDIEKLKDKLEGKEEFYIDEMKKIKDIFELNEILIDELFFKPDCKV